MQQAGGSVDLDVGGTVPIDQHDVLTIIGSAELGGNVKLTRTNNYTPRNGESVRVITFASRSTDEPEYEGLDFGGDAVLNPELGLTNLTFTIGFSSGPSVLSVTPSDSSSTTDASMRHSSTSSLARESIRPPSRLTTFRLVVRERQRSAFSPPAVIADTSSARFRIKLDRSGFENGTYSIIVGPDVRDFVGNR